MKAGYAAAAFVAVLPAAYAVAQVSGGSVSALGTGPFAPLSILKPVVFASIPACGASLEGAIAAITDSNTSTWGATVAGSSTNHILGYCDGTNWTVAGK